jgi:glucose/arabinose dehydrogenase
MVAVFLSLACVAPTASVERQRPTAAPATRISEDVRAEVVAEGLEVPWELAFPPDGRILVTERLGRIRVIRNGALQEAPWATLPVASVSESGLMGMTLHPQFATNGHLYVCYTYRDSGGPLRNRVARLTDVAGVGVDHRVILDGMPGAGNHDGCRLGFGPDGKLYVTMGDAEVSQEAQNLNSLSGKVLRLEADGSVPVDNPFPGSYIYTYGHRNPQGLAWHPITGDLFITEHGPDTNDEVNILRAGSNYGWPQVVGIANDPRYVDPILTFTPTIALAGAAFYSGQPAAGGPASWEGNFLFAALKASHLHRVILAPPDFRTVLSHQRLFEGDFGRLRAVALAPDGYLYFTTSNRDGRGTPRPGDDKVLRLIPSSSFGTASPQPSP